MNEFLIFNGNDKFKINFSLDSTVEEFKKVIAERTNLSDINKFNIFLEKTGFIDNNSSSLKSQLSSFKNNLSNLNQPYSVFCFNKSNPENDVQKNNLCSAKIISNDISQTGVKLKDKDNIIVCLPCAKNCNNIKIDFLSPDDLITDANFTCQCNSDKNNKTNSSPCGCDNDKNTKICKFSSFNLDNVFLEQNEKKEFLTKYTSLLNKQKEEIDQFKKNQKMEELKQKILKRDFNFMEIIHLFEERLQSYKDIEMQQKIKEIIPARPPGSTSEQYVKILLKWYKKEFFTWCNKPKCPKCGQNDKNLAPLNYGASPNSEEKKFLSYRTEIYLCNNCNIEVRFSRYNKTIKLLETRTGRCSEWSNLFGGILYTCGFKTRLINNFEDHVWNEFYNEEEKRWVHIDSCEEAYDTPLVYEQGWGRVMTFILGMSDDGLVEVTPRYVKDWKIINERRSPKMITKLQNILDEVNKKITSGYSKEEMAKIEERRKNEIESFEKKIRTDLYREGNVNVNESEKIGRQSGSLEWRKNRGEC